MNSHLFPSVHDRIQKHACGGIGLSGAFLLLLLGAGIGILFAPESGEKTQAYLAQKARKFKKWTQEQSTDIQETLEDIFGTVNAKVQEEYEDLHADISDRVDELREKQQLTRKKYKELVNDTVTAFSRGKDWTEEAIKKITASLEEEWDKIS